MDVRMLFEGRPFVVEMEDAKRCDLSEQEYRVFLEFQNKGRICRSRLIATRKAFKSWICVPVQRYACFGEFQK